MIDAGPATGIAVDATSFDLYVNHRTSIAIYSAPVDPGDAPTAEIDPGTGGALTDGYGLAVSSFPATAGYVYVADAFDNMVKVYNPKVSTTTPVEEIDGAGTAAGRFVSLKDSSLAVDPSQRRPLRRRQHPAGLRTSARGDQRVQPRRPLPRPARTHNRRRRCPSGSPSTNRRPPTNGQIYVTSGNSSSIVIPPELGPAGLRTGRALLLRLRRRRADARPSPAPARDQGSVQSSSPAGIACPGSCKAEFNSGKNVTLTATPDARLGLRRLVGRRLLGDRELPGEPDRRGHGRRGIRPGADGIRRRVRGGGGDLFSPCGSGGGRVPQRGRARDSPQGQARLAQSLPQEEQGPTRSACSRHAAKLGAHR